MIDKKIYDLDEARQTQNKLAGKLRKILLNNGYDGVVYQNNFESKLDKEDSYIIFRPNQVKSALINTGKFKKTSGNITESIQSVVNIKEIHTPGWMRPDEKFFPCYFGEHIKKAAEIQQMKDKFKAFNKCLQDGFVRIETLTGDDFSIQVNNIVRSRSLIRYIISKLPWDADEIYIEWNYPERGNAVFFSVDEAEKRFK